MNEENNMFGDNGQRPEPGAGQPGYSQQAEAGQEPGYSRQAEAGQEPGYSRQAEAGQEPGYSRQAEAGQEPGYSQQQSYGLQQNYGQQQDYSQQPGYNQYYEGQNEQTPLSGYAEPVYHQDNTDEESQGFGIASLICGILAIVTCCCSCPCAPLAIVSIVLGILQISKGTGKGKGMAIAGIICSAVGLVLMIICLVFTVVLDNSDFSQRYYREYYDILQELEDMDYFEHEYNHHSI